MTNLFSTKQIVGVCFLIIGVSVYLVTGFNFDISLPSMEIPNFNPLKDPCEGCTHIKKQIMSEAKPFENLVNSAMSADTQQTLYDRKNLIDNSDCVSLMNLYNGNPYWHLKPYVAYKIIENGCEV